MKFIARWLPLLRFRGSRAYWEARYRLGGDSGDGSYGEPSRYKALVLNAFVREQSIHSVIEFGCGDGHQLSLAEYPRYQGVDVSSAAIRRCRERYREDVSKRFMVLDDYRGETAQLALSLDVIFHLVEDDVYEHYLERLFESAEQYVVIYSTSTTDAPKAMSHVRHRPVEEDAARKFPHFVRMHEVEQRLPAALQLGQGPTARFSLYQRSMV